LPEKKKFEKDELINVLDQVADVIQNDVEGCLIGGLAMIYHGVKTATKDVDLVFSSIEHASDFENALGEIDFQKVQDLPLDYERLCAQSVFKNDDDHQFDIFYRVVCNKLELSERMIERATEVFSKGKLTLFAITPEDIFLFKSITTRPNDLDDMAKIMEMGLDWSVIEDELRKQPNYWDWVHFHHSQLCELKEQYGINSPLIELFNEDAEIAIGIGTILSKLENNPMQKKEILQILDKDDEAFLEIVFNRMIEDELIIEKERFFYLNEKKIISSRM